MSTPLLPESIDLLEWVRDQISDGCNRIILRHRAAHEIEQQIREWMIDAATSAEALTEAIRMKMNDEARQFRGSTLFALISYLPNRGTHHDRLTRRLEGMAGSSDSFLGESEPPDARGMVAQMMRHNEAAARIALGQTLEIVEHYKSISKERGERVQQLEEKQMQVLEMIEKLSSLQHERNLELVRERRRDQRGEFVVQKLNLLAPVLLSKVLGAKDPKGSGSMMGEELLRQFFNSLTEPQQSAMWQALSGILSGDQVITMAELYQRYGAVELAREKAAAEAAARDGTAPPPPATAPIGSPTQGSNASPTSENGNWNENEEEKKK